MGSNHQELFTTMCVVDVLVSEVLIDRVRVVDKFVL